MKFALIPVVVVGLLVPQVESLAAQQVPIVPDSVIAAVAGEISGETAKRQLEGLARLHRQRGSRDFHAAITQIMEAARRYGLSDIRVDSFPTDGQRFYGTQRSRPAWDADFAELWELAPSGSGWTPTVRLASWDAMPITLTEGSDSARVEAELVDVGNGTAESDYAGKDVRGKLVLAAAQPGPVAPLAVVKYGAAGVVSYAQNQHTAWWGRDEDLIRWGHLDAFAPFRTFGFQVSLGVGRQLQQRLARGETIRLRAAVAAARHPGYYEVVTATIPGADPALKGEEIAYSCHLDHQRPGANDNASGCVTILEAARTLSKLIAEGRLPRPARTLRFIWPPEIEGTTALLVSRPELVARIKTVIHMDMVGGGPVTKAVFHVHRSPASLPSFVNDLAESIADFVNRQTDAFASTGSAAFPLAAPDGGREPLRAELSEFSLGSDHEIYTDGSFRVPAIYFADWPDRYIHTNADRADNIDPTKLARAGFIGATAGYTLANLKPNQLPSVWKTVSARMVSRAGEMLARRAVLSPAEAASLTRFQWEYERGLVASIERFFPLPAEFKAEAGKFVAGLEATLGSGQAIPATGAGQAVFERNAAIKGPMSMFDYDYRTDHYGAERTAKLRLLDYQGLRGGGADYAYEVLNFVDGRRTVQAVRDAVSAAYGPVPLELVREYLDALATIDVVKKIR